MLQYKIYPSILDAYVWYKKSDNAECKQELIDKINRVPFESEAAAKGTAFNALVDSILHCGYDKFYEAITKFDSFEFKTDIIRKFVEELQGSLPQIRVEAEIETVHGNVLLYGNADAVLRETCVDIKTTSRYEFPKFLHNWQHVIYPYCLNRMGIECNSFLYLITDFNNIAKEEYRYQESKILTKLRNELNDFIFFLEMNRENITDKKIFALEDEYVSVNE